MLYPDIEDRIQAFEENPEAIKVQPEQVQDLLAACHDVYQQLIATRQHDRAIALMERLRSLLPEDPHLHRLAALAYSGKGELALQWADQLRVWPSGSLLEAMESLFRTAIEVDPTLPDPYWDIAVLKARFQGDFDEAARCYLRARELGYFHPMIPALEQMLRQRQAPPRPEPTSGEDAFRELLLSLAIQPDVPAEDLFESPGEEAVEVIAPDEPVFDSYYRMAVHLIRTEELDTEAFERVRRAALRIDGDAGELIRDLMRRVSAEYPDDLALQKRATEEHLMALAQASFSLRAQARTNDDPMMRRARRAARRGQQIVDSTTEYPIDPDLHAEMLLAMGQTYARVESFQDMALGEALQYYLQALDLKQAAGNLADFHRLQKLMKRMIAFLLPTAQLASVVGQGTTLTNLETAYEAVRRLDDEGLAFDIAMTLSSHYSQVRQAQLAEEVLRNVLANPDLIVEQRDGARLALASSLSEQHRAPEAAEIQAALIAEDSPLLADPADRSTLYMNYGNSLRLMGELDGAQEAFETALSAASGMEDGSGRRNREAHIHFLMGELWFLRDQPARGDEAFKTAESLFDIDFSGTDRLHFHSLAGRCYFEAGMGDSALPHLESAREILREQLARGPAPSVWESMLHEWSYLDALTVEYHLTSGDDEAADAALLVAEAAKGRLLAWLRWASLEEAPQIALSPERQEEALRKVQAWTAEGPGRRVISLFADKRGLAVFVVGEGGSVSGRWLEEAQYDPFMTDYYEVWEYLFDASADDPRLWDAAGSLTELLLEKIGEWLWRACPQLADGGDDLILIPHRLFRSLPLTHCRLPGGIRLSKCFKRVMISPSLHDFSTSIRAARQTPPADYRRLALVDPDGSLPFARFEGFLAAGVDSTQVGADVTVDAIRQALSTPGVTLISCHGDFDESDPWQSAIDVADGQFKVYELIQPSYRVAADLVVLGVCEAAQTRRSLSDEPLGFPGALVQGGVKAALAPMWQIDDFASLLFVARFFTEIGGGEHPATAAQETAQWLRELTVSQVLDLAAGLLDRAEKLVSEQDTHDTFAQVPYRLRDAQAWLQAEDADSRPFRSSLDWAAFQLVGFLS